MDLTGPLKSEVFRPLATIVVPGAIAVGPWPIILGHYVPQVLTFSEAHPAAFVAMLLICVIAVGLILEDLGAWIEVRWDDSIDRRQPGHKKNWDEYLTLKLQDELVGQRYLRTLVLRMKFELSMAPALVLLVVGLVWINAVYRVWSAWGMLSISLVLLLIATYLLWESYDSDRNLGRMHALIVTAMKATPPRQ